MTGPNHQQLPDLGTTSTLEDADAVVADALLPHAERPAIKGLGLVADLFDQEPLYAAAGATIAVGLILRDNRTIQAGTQILAAHLFATALRGIVKDTVDRTRPTAAAERGEYVLREGERKESDFNSFPSGHTAGAVAVALAASRHYPSARPTAAVIAVLAGTAQVIRSKHYVTDVLAGAAVGWAAEAAIELLLIRPARKV